MVQFFEEKSQRFLIQPNWFCVESGQRISGVTKNESELDEFTWTDVEKLPRVFKRAVLRHREERFQKNLLLEEGHHYGNVTSFVPAAFRTCVAVHVHLGCHVHTHRHTCLPNGSTGQLLYVFQLCRKLLCTVQH